MKRGINLDMTIPSRLTTMNPDNYAVIQPDGHDVYKTTAFNEANASDPTLYDHWYSSWKVVTNPDDSDSYTLEEGLYSIQQVQDILKDEKRHSFKKVIFPAFVLLLIACVTVAISVISIETTELAVFCVLFLLLFAVVDNVGIVSRSFDDIKWFFEDLYGDYRPKPLRYADTRKFALNNLSFDDCNDIINELNECKSKGDVDGYMKIYHALSTEDLAEKAKAENAEKQQQLKEQIAVAERKNKNRFLANTVKDNRVSTLQQNLLQLTKTTTVNDSLLREISRVLEQFNNVDMELDIYNKIAYDNCRLELENAVNNIENMLKSGIVLTDAERLEFEELLKISGAILNRVKDGVLQQVNDRLKTSTTFLKERYLAHSEIQ